MKMQNLLLSLFIAAAQGVTAAVLADEIELLVPIKAGMSPPNAIAEIKVDGNSQKYKSVKNKKLNYIVAVRGDKPNRAHRRRSPRCLPWRCEARCDDLDKLGVP